MSHLLANLLALLFFLSGPATKGNAEIWHSPRAAEETVTLYRGVNSSHVAFESAEQGLVRANGGLATPLEHNTAPGATLRSPYTSWTTDPAVAENFALRPNGGGVVVRAEVPVSQTVPSPNAV